MQKRSRMDMAGNPADPQHTHPGHPGVTDDAFINDRDAVDSGGDDDDDDDKPKSDKKAGRRKIKIEFIQDKSRRHITFSKRKAGMFNFSAYELSTLTGTQVLLLVVSETGLVYTFTTAKLQPLVTQPEGKNLIQACLNAPHGSLPSSMPVGAPLGRSSNIGPPAATPANNMPGGLSIGSTVGGNSKEDEDSVEEDESSRGGRAQVGDKRRRRASSNAGPPPPSSSSNRGGPTASPHSVNSTIPPHLSISSGPNASQSQPSSAHPGTSPQMPMGASPTSPQQGHAVPPANSNPQYASSYGHHTHHPSQHPSHQQQSPDGGMYGGTPAHMMPAGNYSYPGNQSNTTGGQQQLGGLAAAAAQHGHWGTAQQQQQQQPQQVAGQNTHYTRR
ncbi:SRF-type transcription factor (DNA-binding and dimerization domain)-domain-containing protein [Lentinula lateritia]|uniref:SRF-type transcription factor (DNA-binding and dimerization domain)-domain-containing protein n=1 Tax=Lentinula aff. lateritia TaxID=2804960 RepID=A0ACC1TZZ0_9AGAR|nr:SRF-type transcription factor (DNA-binding and dimerization domain)-domain-containing protein [Lentinula aff. lateritia]KAJ3851398.1 SRF-type transcription factor (DNA-binding and dimerization domain)-domain-containing protein [Lentinula lateritia]